ADLSDYFNYGFNEDTWKSYCDKHRRLRMSLEFMTLGSSAKNTDTHNVLLSKSDCSSGKLKSTIDVIEGQAETIIRVEGRRDHSTDGSITQVQSSSEQPVLTEPLSTKLPPFFPPIIPPPPFPLLSISSTPPFVQQLPPRKSRAERNWPFIFKARLEIIPKQILPTRTAGLAPIRPSECPLH
ncbi:pre-mRNA 3'-end-processing factor FIP1 isoform X1, partial [Tachysurus ichikawai]